jgi:hypothetical protein
MNGEKMERKENRREKTEKGLEPYHISWDISPK